MARDIWTEIVVRIGWAATAAVTGAIMARRGHDGGMWAVIGLVLGPFAVPAAVVSARRAARRPPVVVAGGTPEGARRPPGALVVVDAEDPQGWAEQAAAASALGSSVELVAVVGRDTLDRAAREGELRRARQALAVVATAVPGPTPRQLILEGRAEAVVSRYRRLEGIGTVITPSTPLGDRVRRAVDERHRRRVRNHQRGAGTEPRDGAEPTILPGLAGKSGK
ncbi:MAG: hypothetical protein ACLGI2_11375 [Acidimicrobiia bacterium]